MPVRPTFPGVYIEEVPSGVRTIVGVATSVAAFIDYFARGPMDRAIQIFSFADFEREFGGLDIRSEASYAIQQFFLNGGSEAFVIRTGTGFRTATVTLLDSTSADAFNVRAGRLIKGASVDDPGSWGNFVRLDVDYDTSDPTTLFNLTVSEISPVGSQPVLRTETFRNLTATQNLPNSVREVVNEGSLMVQVSAAPLGPNRPVATGTVGTLPALGGIAGPFQLDADINGTTVTVQLSAIVPATLTLAEARTRLEAGLRAAGLAQSPADPRFANAIVQIVGGDRLRVLTGRAGDPAVAGSVFDPASIITFAENGGNSAASLGLTGAGVTANVQQYALGGPTVAGAFQRSPGANSDGNDGNPPGATEVIGVRATKSGMFALEDVDIFNILCIPLAATLAASDAFAVYSAAEAYCLERRAFLIIDIPPTVDRVQDMKDWLDSNPNLRSRNAAVYFPRLRIADPLNQFRLRDFGPSGTLAGLYARTDNDRGVWKAPAGIDATLRNVNELSYVLTDPENGALNPLGVDCLRTFPIIGTVSWGARTLDGADALASEWKYLPVRRFALFLEESLYRGTKFAVFEPNDEPLWAQIRLNVGAFMQTLFRQGAFQGQTPRDAYFVKCDKETTTQNDINQGIVNILVGFAPLKPAEFVIIRISQIAGQIEV
jgi:phage tail sheath protein FI